MTDAELSKALEIEAERDQLRIEVERLRTVLLEVEKLGWKEGLGAEHAIASHYAIRKVVRSALEQGSYPSPRDDFSPKNDPFHDEQQGNNDG